MNTTGSPRTVIQKIIDAHTVHKEGGRTLLYVDRVILADTARSAFNLLKDEGREVRRPRQVIAIPDHFTPSSGTTFDDIVDDERRDLIRDVEVRAKEQGILVFGVGDPRRGIQHIVSTEQALAQPGVIIVAADSHTPTQGAVGALAFSVGTDLAHALATQCVWIQEPRTLRIQLEGDVAENVTAKDVVMAVIAKMSSTGASGLAIEYGGNFIRHLPVESRMTLCNMSVEMGARFAIVPPDDITFEYLRNRPFAPSGRNWENALVYWRTLSSDDGAPYAREMTFDVANVQPMVTWGCNAEDAVSITSTVPDPAVEDNDERRAQMQKSLEYMGLKPRTKLTDVTLDQVFIGSCANSTLEDLRAAAQILRGRRVTVPTLVVPGSGLVKAKAEEEGLDQIFRSAGAAWGEAGCSMCSAMNGDIVRPGARCASTSNRNHMGRQGPGSRTHLVSPPTAAASAVMGHLADVRKLEGA
ncbi:3-isopropylmalate dehydratase large subunit [Caballeronia novacaledonica]|uniref:3-isopropylmalate dehydratase n=1 Tax=Caballeronia novacaledonica TaxID=1544861 RepID=A0AA37MJJ2_9BURK|nr:3-isopropylmalate dehydratase large subunit [Caballeronia novacaledonica]GJH30060.1 3-isopropylmalate dehydratase large subunit [Caballeronia novacaledonica]